MENITKDENLCIIREALRQYYGEEDELQKIVKDKINKIKNKNKKREG